VSQRTSEPHMHVSRRDILRGAAATLLTGASSAAAAVPALAAAGGGSGGAVPSPGRGRLSRAAFADQVGSDFRVRLGAVGRATLRLGGVRGLAPPPGARQPAPGREGFSLLFSGSARAGVPQGTYTIEHDRLGSFLLFLVPVGPRAPELSYEAVVNRLWP
jgi:hypothetical protein